MKLHGRITAGQLLHEGTVSKIHELTFKNRQECTQALFIKQGTERERFFEYV